MSGHWESIANAAKSRADLRCRLAAATTDNRGRLPAIVEHLVQGFERLLSILFVTVIQRLIHKQGLLRVLIPGLARLLSTIRFSNGRCGSGSWRRCGLLWLPLHDHKAGIQGNVLFQLVQLAGERDLHRHAFVTHPGGTYRHHRRKTGQRFSDIAVIRQGIDPLKYDIHARRLTYLAGRNRVAAGVSISPTANHTPCELFRVCRGYRLFGGIHAHTVKHPARTPLTTRATDTHE